MSKYILLLVAIFSFVGAEAQFVPRQQLGEGFILTKEKELDIEGTPYLTEGFKRGKIKLEGKSPVDVYLRYNVQDEEMEIKTDLDSDEIFKFSGGQGAEYVIGDRNFKKESNVIEGRQVHGFFEELYDGQKVRLIGKAVAKVSEAVPAKNSYESDKPGRISIEQQYFVVFEDGRTEEVEPKRRTLRKVFDSKEAKNYLKDNKVKSVEDMVAFVKFYDGI